jgi:spore coat polysaccharide biosynthesis protein SpsF
MPLKPNAADWKSKFFADIHSDLSDRHYQAQVRYGSDVTVKIPTDCPLIDPAVIDRVIGNYLAAPVDFVSNLHPPTYPDGNDVEVMSAVALERAWKRGH